MMGSPGKDYIHCIAFQFPVREMVKCPSCGSENPTYVSFCGSCGTSIPRELKVAQEGTPQQPASQLESESVPMKKCNWCGEPNKWNASFCIRCGRDPHGHAYLQGSETLDTRPESGLPVAGGVLTIIAGLLSLGMGLSFFFAESVVLSLGGYGSGTLCFCGGLCILFGLAGMWGGINAIQRKKFMFSLAGSIMAMLGLGFFVGALLGLIGTILIAVSKEEFED